MNESLKQKLLTGVFLLMCANALAMLWILLTAGNSGHAKVDDAPLRLDKAQTRLRQAELSIPQALEWIGEDEFPRDAFCYKWTGLRRPMSVDKARALLASGPFSNKSWALGEPGEHWALVVSGDDLAAYPSDALPSSPSGDGKVISTHPSKADAAAAAKDWAGRGYPQPALVAFRAPKQDVSFIFMPSTQNEMSYAREIVSKIDGTDIAPTPCPESVAQSVR